MKFGIEVQLGTQDQTLFWHARDNAVSSLGKVLKYQSKFVPNLEEAFAYWLENLPIENDKEEAKIMNAFLADSLTENYKFVFGSQNQRVGQVIKALAAVPPEEVMNKKTVKKFKDFFSNIAKHDNTCNNFIWKEVNKLSGTQKTRMQKLI